MRRLIFICLFFLCTQSAYSQLENCTNVDTSLCYAKASFLLSDIGIEKKWESKDRTGLIKFIIADLDNDCIPEMISDWPYSGLELVILNTNNANQGLKD